MGAAILLVSFFIYKKSRTKHVGLVVILLKHLFFTSNFMLALLAFFQT